MKTIVLIVSEIAVPATLDGARSSGGKKRRGALPHAYRADARLWERLGYPAFSAMAVVYFLMVVKPGL